MHAEDKANTSTGKRNKLTKQELLALADYTHTRPVVERSFDSPDANLVDFIEQLQKIDTIAPLAKENALSISDNNGGRIWL